MQRRYDQLLKLVDQAKPRTIVEIGVWNGKRAQAMAEVALKYHDNVRYTGYDLFEDATDATDQAELNAKAHNTLDRVTGGLNAFRARHPGFTFTLVKGNTRQTLREPITADFAYIDGGHSVETIRSDYEAVKDCPVVVFDDYYMPDGDAPCVDLDRYGANRIVDAIDGAEVLPSTDALTMNGRGVRASGSSQASVIRDQRTDISFSDT